MKKYLFINNYRLQVIKADDIKPLNWLFLPGGPGIGSQYLEDFVIRLNLPGSKFIGDFPGDGDNRNVDDINYDNWKSGLLEVIRNLAPCMLVTHSFSGMFALTIPELENLISGLVIMSSAPDAGWIKELVNSKEKYDLPDTSAVISQFYSAPTDENFKVLCEAQKPYLFTRQELEEGQKILDACSYNAKAKLWVDQNFHMTYQHNWCPTNIPTVIIGSKDDRLLPIKLFLDQDEWVRDNIQILKLENTGHFPFLSCFGLIDEALSKLADKVLIGNY